MKKFIAKLAKFAIILLAASSLWHHVNVRFFLSEYELSEILSTQFLAQDLPNKIVLTGRSIHTLWETEEIEERLSNDAIVLNEEDGFYYWNGQRMNLVRGIVERELNKLEKKYAHSAAVRRMRAEYYPLSLFYIPKRESKHLEKALGTYSLFISEKGDSIFLINHGYNYSALCRIGEHGFTPYLLSSYIAIRQNDMGNIEWYYGAYENDGRVLIPTICRKGKRETMSNLHFSMKEEYVFKNNMIQDFFSKFSKK